MNWITQFFKRRRIFSDLSEEIQQHLTEKTEALMDEGMSRDDAEQAARREFGNLTRVEELSRQAWIWPTIEGIFADLKLAFRKLGRSPGFTATALLILALRIGATTAMYSIVRRGLLSPLPYKNPTHPPDIDFTQPRLPPNNYQPVATSTVLFA